MLNLAEGLELILRRRHPEYAWIVEVMKPDADDRPDGPLVPGCVDEPGAVADDAHATSHGHDAAATPGTLNDDRLDEAA